ncbi:hypothetical protein CC2G_002192 [Coprinopsis cinerea AmutBmut pab1-1]|nr:hypothetical protein CC2G_002192 [Coprinopsis cinerea AmutBmut pab1-1]
MEGIPLDEKFQFVKDMLDVLQQLYQLTTTTSLHVADIKPRIQWLKEYSDDLPEYSQDDHEENLNDSLDSLAAIQRLLDKMLTAVKQGRLKASEHIAVDIE